MRTKLMKNEGNLWYFDTKRFLPSQKPRSKCELYNRLAAAVYLRSVNCVAIGEQTHASKDRGSPSDGQN